MPISWNSDTEWSGLLSNCLAQSDYWTQHPESGGERVASPEQALVRSLSSLCEDFQSGEVQRLFYIASVVWGWELGSCQLKKPDAESCCKHPVKICGCCTWGYPVTDYCCFSTWLLHRRSKTGVSALLVEVSGKAGWREGGEAEREFLSFPKVVIQSLRVLCSFSELSLSSADQAFLPGLPVGICVQAIVPYLGGSELVS